MFVGGQRGRRAARVATPLLAGRVVDEIGRRRGSAWSWRWPLVIAAIAIAEAGVSLVTRWLSSTHRRRPDPRPAHRRVRPRAADAGRVLHPHPDRRTGQPAQQRRDRRAARVLRHACRRGRQRRHAGADARRDARHLLAGHAAGAGAAADVRAARPAGWAHRWRGCRREAADPQRGDEHPDDRAVLRARRDAGQAVRQTRPTRRASSTSAPAGSATSASAPRCCSRSS